MDEEIENEELTIKERLQLIQNLLNQRSILKIKKQLKEIEKQSDGLESQIKEYGNYKEFALEIKRLIRNLGKTNVVTIPEIDELIIKYDIK